jgi:hypothetical protein
VRKSKANEGNRVRYGVCDALVLHDTFNKPCMPPSARAGAVERSSLQVASKTESTEGNNLRDNEVDMKDACPEVQL